MIPWSRADLAEVEVVEAELLRAIRAHAALCPDCRRGPMCRTLRTAHDAAIGWGAQLGRRRLAEQARVREMAERRLFVRSYLAELTAGIGAWAA